VATAERPPTGSDRVLAVLKELASHPGGASLDELSRALDAPKSSVHRALGVLRRAGFAEQDRRSRYRVGTELVRVAFEYYEQRHDDDVVRPVLERLSARLSETAHYARLDGAEVVYLAKVEPQRQAIAMSSRIGGRNPAHSTGVGKALLAHELRDERAARAFIRAHGPLERRTRNTLVSARALAADLAETRERGYALDREESEPGVNCIAFPVFLDSPMHPTGAISVSAVAMRAPLEQLVAAAEDIRAIIEQPFGPVTRPSAAM
jgi:IclR family transcriptional regulator, acetate operon repressor